MAMLNPETLSMLANTSAYILLIAVLLIAVWVLWNALAERFDALERRMEMIERIMTSAYPIVAQSEKNKRNE